MGFNAHHVKVIAKGLRKSKWAVMMTSQKRY